MLALFDLCCSFMEFRRHKLFIVRGAKGILLKVLYNLQYCNCYLQITYRFRWVVLAPSEIENGN